MSEHPLPPRRLWWLGAGFALWCSALVMLYALHAIGCTFGWGAAALRVSLAFVFVAHVVVIAWLWLDVAARSLVSDPRRVKPATEGRLAAARYFFGYELPKIDPWLAVVARQDVTCVEVPDDAF